MAAVRFGLLGIVAACLAGTSLSITLSHRYRARVSYDGTGFSGFQLQAGRSDKRTVQEVLEHAISQRLQRPVRVVAAGRTDAGVHARGQAIHFDYASKSNSEPLSDGELMQVEHSWNRMLPSDVRVFHLQRAPPPFPKAVNGTSRLVRWSAMMDCTGKLYSYRLNLHPHAMDPLQRFSRWHPDYPSQIDVRRLERVLRMYEGTHDFRAFAGQVEQLEKATGAKVDTTRKVFSARLVDEGEHNYRVDFHLEGALYKQVRNMVGAAIDVCRHRGRSGSHATEERLEWLLRSGQAARRDNRSKPAPPQGLVLEQVYFPSENGIVF